MHHVKHGHLARQTVFTPTHMVFPWQAIAGYQGRKGYGVDVLNWHGCMLADRAAVYPGNRWVRAASESAPFHV